MPLHLRSLGIGHLQFNLITESDDGNKNLSLHLLFLRKGIQHILDSLVKVLDFISGHTGADIQKQNDGKRFGGRGGELWDQTWIILLINMLVSISYNSQYWKKLNRVSAPDKHFADQSAPIHLVSGSEFNLLPIDKF